MRQAGLLGILLILAACASSPLHLDGVNRNITPAMIHQDTPYTGQRVVWGGRIIKTQPLAQTTHIEVLAYPLDGDGMPEFHQPSLGRFVIIQQGFLEPADFAHGRHISVVGRIGNMLDGHIGAAPYQFPVIHAQQIQLWPKDQRRPSNIHFGIGVGIRL